MRQLIGWTACLICCLVGTSAAQQPNQLSKSEREERFQLLFDGKTFQGWQHGGNWKVEDGVLTREGRGGSLKYTAARVPDDFELRFDWKVASGSNSGVYYRPGQYEYQILDNSKHADGKNPRTSAASLYFCMPPSHDATRPVGQWNQAKIICKGTIIQHWLNGKKVIHFDYTDAKWKKEVEMLKMRGGTLAERGANLSLQDHGDPVWYRSVKMRTLTADDEIDMSSVEPAEISPEVARAEQEKLARIVANRKKRQQQQERKKKQIKN